MTQALQRVTVLGLGKVGLLVGILLHKAGFEVLGLDAGPKPGLSFATAQVDIQDRKSLQKYLSAGDAVVSCLPWHLNKQVAEDAAQMGLHYFDLTEDVATTNHIRKLSANATGVMAPQCGLAPGFIGIVGAHLAKNFERLRSLELRVGALPQHPSGELGYAFNWSAEGVVNEYLNPCEVIENSHRTTVQPLSGLETIVIDGHRLEAFATSGGLGTLCETFEGKIERLNYKSLRYPGHGRLMRFFFHDLHMAARREEAGDILVNAKPPVNEDVVYVHAAAEGWQQGQLRRQEFVRAYRPVRIEGHMWKAIAWTTAGSVVSVIEMVANGQLPSKGFLKQEAIPLAAFLQTSSGKLYAQT